jgi:protein SCO1/2
MSALWVCIRSFGLALALAAAVAGPLAGQTAGRSGPGELGLAPDSAEDTPQVLSDVGFDQRLGEPLPLDLVLTDETGQPVRLGDFFGDRPVLLSLVYYECPMLCPMTLSGLASSLKALEWSADREFEVVVVSIDPAEGPEEARKAKALAVHRYGRAGTEEGWHFLTGDGAAIERLAAAVGFRYRYEPERDEFAHAAGLVLATPAGAVARYFFGIEYPAKDLKLGLVEAADGEIGSLVDQLLLYCFHYDPQIGRYVWSQRAILAMRIAAVGTLLAIGSFILLALRQEKRKTPPSTRTA